mmetsp:Transcript_56427/g.155939  ORF Transcript_56427/g.155939 Transcript_56427/m.155939 type:complete len:279 (-) Transcript_56427:423-1259(-)
MLAAMRESKSLKGSLGKEFEPLDVDTPTEFDWRDTHMVTPVKDQGCGDCWAFSSIGAIESQLLINGYGSFLHPTILSEQQIVDCAPNPDNCGGTGGCEGSIQPLAFEYLLGAGVETRVNYTYTGKDGTCADDKNGPAAATIDSYGLLPENCDEETLKQYLVTKGPISVTVATHGWTFYSRGILRYATCGADVDHAVLLVGYGTEVSGNSTKDYWTIKNSWGSWWGEDGYIRISRDAGSAVDKTPADGTGCDDGPRSVTVNGTCGIYYANSYVEGAKLV